jgi:hypothetical protein
MKELKQVEKSPEGKRIDKEKSGIRKIENTQSEARSMIRPSCGCGCAPFAKEK